MLLPWIGHSPGGAEQFCVVVLLTTAGAIDSVAIMKNLEPREILI